MHSFYCSKRKFTVLQKESVGGCSSPSSRPWARRWRTTNVCDVWPVRRQTYGFLPSRKASPPIGWYQIILLVDRGTCVLTTCPGLHSTAERPGFELATYWSQVQRPNHSATEPHEDGMLPTNWAVCMCGYWTSWGPMWRLPLRGGTHQWKRFKSLVVILISLH